MRGRGGARTSSDPFNAGAVSASCALRESWATRCYLRVVDCLDRQLRNSGNMEALKYVVIERPRKPRAYNSTTSHAGSPCSANLLVLSRLNESYRLSFDTRELGRVAQEPSSDRPLRLHAGSLLKSTLGFANLPQVRQGMPNGHPITRPRFRLGPLGPITPVRLTHMRHLEKCGTT